MTHASRNTTTGLIFEADTPINQIFNFLYEDGKEVLMFANSEKSAIQTDMLDWRKYVKNLSNLKYIGTGNARHPIIWRKNYIPDGAIIKDNILYIIEKKFQKVGGSADEKLNAGEFRRDRFEQLAKYYPMEIKEVKYLFLLGEWFKIEEYKDRIDYERREHPKVEFMFYDEAPPYDFFNTKQVKAE